MSHKKIQELALTDIYMLNTKISSPKPEDGEGDGSMATLILIIGT